MLDGLSIVIMRSCEVGSADRSCFRGSGLVKLGVDADRILCGELLIWIVIADVASCHGGVGPSS